MERAGTAIPEWASNTRKPHEKAEETGNECRDSVSGVENVISDSKACEHKKGESTKAAGHHKNDFHGDEFVWFRTKEREWPPDEIFV